MMLMMITIFKAFTLKKSKILKLLLTLSIISLLSGCASTEIVVKNNYLVPDKVTRPTSPKLYKLNENASLCSPDNFKKLQINVLSIEQYIKTLNATIDYYEQTIDDFNAKKLKSEQE